MLERANKLAHLRWQWGFMLGMTIMKILNKNICIKSSAAIAFMAFGLSSAQALEISAEASGTIGGSAFPTDTDIATSGSIGVNDYIFGTSTGQYNVWGNDTGSFGSITQGSGIYDITGTFIYTDTIVNTTGIEQSFDLAFEIMPGEISLNGMPTSLSEFMLAEYAVEILVGGVTIWDSSASIYKDGASSSATFSFDGMPLSDTSLTGPNITDSADFSGYYWDSYVESISLGVLSAGGSLDFEYRLTSHVAGNAVFDSSTDCSSSASGQWHTGSCGALARVGDPFHFGDGGMKFSSTPTGEVPLPGSLLLMGAGLIGFAATYRRK